jgi:hypothetical protein
MEKISRKTVPSGSPHDETPTRASPLGAALRLGLSAGAAVTRPATQFAGRTVVRGTRAAVDAALDSGLIDDALASPVFDRLTQRVLDSPSMERLVVRVIDSRLVDAAVARLLESEDLWIVVDEVARSPSVTEAISHQSLGFAEQVTGAVRERSIRADDRLERAARRLLRRQVPEGDEPAPDPAAP